MILLISFISATNRAQFNEATKVEEFGDLGCDDLLVRLDYFANDVMKRSQSRGYIVVYEGKHVHNIYRRGEFIKTVTSLPRFGESTTQSNLMLMHLFRFRGFSRDKFLVISGGFRESYEVELWLVPKGALPPKISPTLEKMNYQNGTVQHVCHGLG